jgi:prevent-host-death family protein
MAEVGVAQLRRDLKAWLERVAAGDEVVITDRGRPIARLSAVDTAPILDRLTADGRLSGPAVSARPSLRNRPRVQAEGPVADLVVAERDARR